MVSFHLVVTPEFWDHRRVWPAGCRPVVFSTALMMRNTGLLQIPAPFAAEVERMLAAHPAVVSVARAATPAGEHGTALRDAA